MAKRKTKIKSSKKSNRNRFKLSNQQKLVIGSTLLVVGVYLLIAFLSYFYTGQADQSVLSEFPSRETKASNWVSTVGAQLSHFFLYRGFGIASFLFSGLIFLSGIYVVLDINKARLKRHWFWGTLIIIWLSVALGFTYAYLPLLGGTIGYEINMYLQAYIGDLGIILLLVLTFIIYLAIRFNTTSQPIIKLFNRSKGKTIEEKQSDSSTVTFIDNTHSEEAEKFKTAFNMSVKTKKEDSVNPADTRLTSQENERDNSKYNKANEVKMEVEALKEEQAESGNLSDKLVKNFGEFDPTLDLSTYQFPNLELLKTYDLEGITINKDELEENKNRILETLGNYKIGIASIKATIGPTVTLYEIVPDAGIRISKIKNLEDDIALSLSALGIRIIAPIPGKGTIGIEVPNKKPTVVSMHSVISSSKFQNAKMQLPVALGKTISNETFVVDLAKMPHLLMAGATGQGKSVGLNAVLTSLLYKKHPAEVKFVLVDPKKVELTLFNKIERHYLAKLPDSEEAIITDNTKVINTLNSLCIEMDNRYELLKDAFCRNIKEYNDKFKSRKLNPNDGHKFLPYIILVVDEFADLIMTAGKEVETPIARLAQLARAIGIHLIIATQRPSVNVITGLIKANFPARIAFRVTSKIDSRTILDGAGADQLIGRGDMLFTQGNDMIRIQCAFVDAPEVERITEFIGSQKAYPEAYILPEFIGEDSGTSIDVDISDRDALFRDAAELIVIAQQGSASLLQRKLKLGYNRAGRLIDQLEAAGIVGQFEGSKARQVLIPDLEALESLLNETNNSN